MVDMRIKVQISNTTRKPVKAIHIPDYVMRLARDKPFLHSPFGSIIGKCPRGEAHTAESRREFR